MISSKFQLNSVKSFMNLPSQVGNMYHVMGAQLPISFVHMDYHKFSIFLDMSKAVDQTHSKKHTDSYFTQTNMINIK